MLRCRGWKGLSQEPMKREGFWSEASPRGTLGVRFTPPHRSLLEGFRIQTFLVFCRDFYSYYFWGESWRRRRRGHKFSPSPAFAVGQARRSYGAVANGAGNIPANAAQPPSLHKKNALLLRGAQCRDDSAPRHRHSAALRLTNIEIDASSQCRASSNNGGHLSAAVGTVSLF